MATSEVKEPTGLALGPAQSVDQAEAAYARIEPEILQMDEAEVGRANAEVPYAVSIVLGALVNVETLREAMISSLSLPPLEELSKVRDYALATLFAHLQIMPTRIQAQLALLREEAAPLRERLLISAEALAHFGLFDPDEVAHIRAGTGPLDAAEDLVALVGLFRRHWSVVSGKTAVTEAELTRAGELGPQILEALGNKTVGRVGRDDAIDWAARRNRAFRLLVRCYDEIRRAVTYVRWRQGDSDRFAPTLYQRRRTRAATAPAANPSSGTPRP